MALMSFFCCFFIGGLLPSKSGMIFGNASASKLEKGE